MSCKKCPRCKIYCVGGRDVLGNGKPYKYCGKCMVRWPDDEDIIVYTLLILLLVGGLMLI